MINKINFTLIFCIIMLSCNTETKKKDLIKTINPEYNLLFSEYSEKNIVIDYYSISSHEEIIIINNYYKEIGIIYQLRENKFVDISNSLDAIEMLYSSDTTLLDTYILSTYKSFLYHLPDSICKVTVCNKDEYEKPVLNASEINDSFKKKNIESDIVFNYENTIYPTRVYESDYVVIVVFIEKYKIIPVFADGDRNIIKLKAYALLKVKDDINNFIMQNILDFKNCKENIIKIK